MARQNGICRLVSRPVGRRIGRVVSAPASDRIALMDRNDADGPICPVASCIRRTVGQTVLRAEFFIDSRKRPRQISRPVQEYRAPAGLLSQPCEYSITPSLIFGVNAVDRIRAYRVNNDVSPLCGVKYS